MNEFTQNYRIGFSNLSNKQSFPSVLYLLFFQLKKKQKRKEKNKWVQLSKDGMDILKALRTSISWLDVNKY